MLFIIRLNLVALLLSIQTISIAQNIDSLEWIKKQKDDTAKVKFLIRFSRSFRETDHSKALELGIAAKSLSKKLNFVKGIFKSNDNLSVIYNNHDQFGQSLKVIKEMIDLSDSIKNNALLISAKFRMARTYHFMGADVKSIKVYEEILELLPKSGESEPLARCSWEMADSYTFINNYKLAEEHFTKALGFYINAKDYDAVMRIYISLGELKEQQNEHTDAINYFKKAITVLEQHNEIPYQAHFYSYIRMVWAKSSFNDGQSHTAYNLYSKALDNQNVVGGSVNAACMVGLGEVHLKNKNYSEAVSCLEKAVNFFEEKRYYKPVMVKAYTKLIEAYEQLHFFEKADANWRKLSVVKDSVSARQQRKELNELNIRYEVDQNEKQIVQFEREKNFINVILIFLSGLVLVTFFFVWLFVSHQRMNYLSERRELEMIAMRAQMNPHFIFNCLNSINDFIIKSERELSSKYLAKFAKLIRYILNNSKTTFVRFENELDAVKLYLELEAMRFEDKFTYQIALAPEIKSLEMKIPSMIVQPYVENSIWHGIQHLAGEGNLQVSFKLNGRYLVCIIEDNGIGRPASSNLVSSKKNGKIVEVHGTQIAQDRLSQMVKIGYLRAGVNVVDLKSKEGNSMGTRVELTLPYKLKREITPHL